MRLVQRLLLKALNALSANEKWCLQCGHLKYLGIVFPKWSEGDCPVKGEYKWVCPFCKSSSN
jgi:hypothetical protein